MVEARAADGADVIACLLTWCLGIAVLAMVAAGCLWIEALVRVGM